MTLYEKYMADREKYLPVYKNMAISYNKEKNSITYKDGNGYSLIVQYSPDMKICGVASVTNGAFGTEKIWTSLNKLFKNLGSNKWYYDFSSSYNPYNEVSPLHLEAMENQGLFDVMMATASEYIRQNSMDVSLGVKHTGFGYAATPVAVARKGKLAYGEYPYNESVLYTQDYFERTLSKKNSQYLQFALESREGHGRTEFLEVIENALNSMLDEQSRLTQTDIEK